MVSALLSEVKATPRKTPQSMPRKGKAPKVGHEKQKDCPVLTGRANAETMSKYNNQKTRIGKYTFDSKKEAERFVFLKARLDHGEIEKLALQVPFELQPAFVDADGHKHRAIIYIADFVYIEAGQWIVEDVKGYKTEVYKLKKKLFDFKYKDEGITLKEI